MSRRKKENKGQKEQGLKGGGRRKTKKKAKRERKRKKKKDKERAMER